jgi:hypothetical protein
MTSENNLVDGIIAGAADGEKKPSKRFIIIYLE